MSTRTDIIALDEAALIMLANRGLYKRAVKDLSKGQGPEIELNEDGTIVGRFPECTTTLAPSVAFKQTSCTCGATRVCRHRVATVLAYQAQNESEPLAERPTFVLDEERLKFRLGSGAYASALRHRARGYSATVRYASPPVVLLPTCTVTFLVPWDLTHVRCDCIESVDCEHVAMAVWALAQTTDDGGEHLVGLGHEAAQTRGYEAVFALSSFVSELIRGGWGGALEGIAPRIQVLGVGLSKHRLVWLEDLVDTFAGRLDEYASGVTGSDAQVCNALLTEAAMRVSAHPCGGIPQSHLHGEGISGATKLDQVLLRGLGARYRVSGRVGRLSVFFCESGSEDALVMQRTWTVEQGATVPSGPAIASRRLAGATARSLATANVTTTGATRKPNRVIDVTSRRLQTSVMPGTGARLKLQDDYAAICERLAARAPEALSPRVRAWRVQALAFGEVQDLGYDPGQRTVWGVIVDAEGTRAMVVAEWRPEAPAGPGLLARALLQGASYLTAEVYLRRGMLWLEPLTLGFAEGPVPVDLHEEVEIPQLPTAALPNPDDPLVTVVHSAQDWLGQVALRGVAHLTRAQLDAGAHQVRSLQDAGLIELGAELRGVIDVSGDRVAAWRRASARAEVMTHVLARQSGES